MEYDDDYTGASGEPEHSGEGWEVTRPIIPIDAFYALTCPDEEDEQMLVRVVGIRDDGNFGFEFIVIKSDGSALFVGTETELAIPDEEEPDQSEA